MIPKESSPWDAWAKNLEKYDEPFMMDRNQPESGQERAGLDEIFD